MRRSICSAEPTTTFAGETGTWKFSYTTATPLPKGTRLRFDLLSMGRECDWEIPQTNPKEKENLIWCILPNGKTLEATQKEEEPINPVYDFTLPIDMKIGETLAICLGKSRCQTTVQRKRPFQLYIDTKGKGDFKEPETFLVDVKGNLLQTIRVNTPSLVARNRRFDILVRFEDRFGNPTGNAPEGTLIELSYEHLRDNLTWKLFVPETGFINLPNLYFNEPGVYKIQLRNMSTQEKFLSAPIKCLPETPKSIFWGLFHGESVRYDSTDNIEHLLRYMRDDRCLQFFSTSCFESIEETSNEAWKHICNHIAEMNEEGRFSTFLGFQWCGEEKGEGLRQILYMKDNKPILRKKDSKFNTLKKIYRSHNAKDFFSIPSFSMAKGFQNDFSEFDPDFERVVEIFNAWGSSECTEKEGNAKPIATEDEGIESFAEGSIRAALNKGCRFGFVAGGLDDRGIFEGLYSSGQVQYLPGLTAVIGTEHTREGILQAIQARSCYATTGRRIVLGFSIAGSEMGTELNTKVKPGLAFNRHITGYVCATAPIKEIAFIRNGQAFHTLMPKQTTSFEFTYDDTEPLQNCIIDLGEEKEPFAYYYLRLVQEDGHIAWSSPIWIEFPEYHASAKKKAPAPVKKK
jgi:hypothetical protein